MSKSKISLDTLVQERYNLRAAPVVNPLVSSVGVSVVKVLNNNPQRIQIVFVNMSNNVIYLSPYNDVSNTKGIYISPNGGNAIFKWREDFHLCSWEWYAIASAADSAIYILTLEIT